MTSVERGLREASGDRHPYSRTAVAGMWMFCKRLSCRHCEEAGFLICSEGASGEHTCPGFVSMSTLPYSGRRAGSFSAPLLRAFLCANSLMDSKAFGSVMSRETLGLSPYASILLKRLSDPPASGDGTSSRAPSALFLSTELRPSLNHREGCLLMKHGIVWPGAPPVKAPGLLFFGTSSRVISSANG